MLRIVGPGQADYKQDEPTCLTSQLKLLGGSVAGGESQAPDGSEWLRISELVMSDPVRSKGVDPAHLDRLISTDCELPPILVHRTSRRVLDGFHRVAVALERGQKSILVRYVDATVESAFVLAVEANVRHGLPLSLSDRRVAATRILDIYPRWSDRRIAAVTGLSSRTVAGIRSATGTDNEHQSRVGKDGRRRPLSTAAGRALAAELIRERPQASLREIASVAGISPGTVKDVRDKLNRGDNPVEGRRSIESPSQGGHRSCEVQDAIEPVVPPSDIEPLLHTLARDPALRMTEDGRRLLRWLHTHAVNPRDSPAVSQRVPDHCVDQLVELADRCAANWATIADRLRSQSPASLSLSAGRLDCGIGSTA